VDAPSTKDSGTLWMRRQWITVEHEGCAEHSLFRDCLPQNQHVCADTLSVSLEKKGFTFFNFSQ
jgi:hypothetical protein